MTIVCCVFLTMLLLFIVILGEGEAEGAAAAVEYFGRQNWGILFICLFGTFGFCVFHAMPSMFHGSIDICIFVLLLLIIFPLPTTILDWKDIILPPQGQQTTNPFILSHNPSRTQENHGRQHER